EHGLQGLPVLVELVAPGHRPDRGELGAGPLDRGLRTVLHRDGPEGVAAPHPRLGGHLLAPRLWRGGRCVDDLGHVTRTGPGHVGLALADVDAVVARTQQYQAREDHPVHQASYGTTTMCPSLGPIVYNG